ncbi:MAG: hypothetical protein IKB97_01345 [Bacteroidaceae bacterium]|nr:hypothetical protein [Bacteroidaceae bacterium]
MKRIYFIVSLFMASVGAIAEKNDTLVDVRRADRVVLTQNKSSFCVDIYGQPNNPDYHYRHTRMAANDASLDERALGWDFTFPMKKKSNKRKVKRYLSIASLHFGFVSAIGAPKNMDIDMGSSYEIGFIPLKLNRRWEKNIVSIGLGFNWANYRLSSNYRFVTSSGRTTIQAYPDGAVPDYSRIKVFSLNIPLEYSLRLKRSWEVGLAAIVNFNTYASTETRYSLDNRTEKDFNKHLHHNRFTIDLQASLRWKAVGAYVKYKPFQVFKKDFGPRFSGISTGITLFY